MRWSTSVGHIPHPSYVFLAGTASGPSIAAFRLVNVVTNSIAGSSPALTMGPDPSVVPACLRYELGAPYALVEVRLGEAQAFEASASKPS